VLPHLRPLELKPADLDRIKYEVFFKKPIFSRPSKSMERTDISRFWILLVLSGVIAAGSDSRPSLREGRTLVD
jgi:hypothetical protein